MRTFSRYYGLQKMVCCIFKEINIVDQNGRLTQRNHEKYIYPYLRSTLIYMDNLSFPSGKRVTPK